MGSPPEMTNDAMPADTWCGGCGYDLRGLLAEGHCPECGEPVARWREAPLLINADPRWLRQMVIGLLLIAAGMAAWDMMVQLTVWGGPSVLDDYFDPIGLVGWFPADLVSGLPLLVMLAGVLLFTARPPNPVLVTVGARWRMSGRVLMLARAAIFAVLYVLYYAETWFNRYVVPAPYIFSPRYLPRWTDIVWEALGLAVIVALTLYARRLARLGDHRWLAHAMVLLASFAVMVHVYLWLLIDVRIYNEYLVPPYKHAQALALAFGVQGLLIVCACLWLATLLWWYSRRV